MLDIKPWDLIRITSVDLSTTKIGWCVGIGPQYEKSGTIDLEALVGGSRAKDDLDATTEEWAWERVAQSWFELTRLLKDTSPDRVACEVPRPNRNNQRTNRLMGGAQGVLAAVAMREGHSINWGRKVIWVQPDAVRRTDFHKKNRRFTAKVFGTTVKEMTPDRADAIGIWTVAWGKLKEAWMESQANAERWRGLVEG